MYCATQGGAIQEIYSVGWWNVVQVMFFVGSLAINVKYHLAIDKQENLHSPVFISIMLQPVITQV